VKDGPALEKLMDNLREEFRNNLIPMTLAPFFIAMISRLEN
jgi:hypothetical protein